MSSTTFAFNGCSDVPGPEKIVCCPAIGGVRMAADVFVDEVIPLDQAMTMRRRDKQCQPN